MPKYKSKLNNKNFQINWLTVQLRSLAKGDFAFVSSVTKHQYSKLMRFNRSQAKICFKSDTTFSIQNRRKQYELGQEYDQKSQFIAIIVQI